MYNYFIDACCVISVKYFHVFFWYLIAITVINGMKKNYIFDSQKCPNIALHREVRLNCGIQSVVNNKKNNHGAVYRVAAKWRKYWIIVLHTRRPAQYTRVAFISFKIFIVLHSIWPRHWILGIAMMCVWKICRRQTDGGGIRTKPCVSLFANL